MASKPNLAGMDVQALIELRTQVEKRLSEKRSELQEQLRVLGGTRVISGDRASKLAGTRVAPKYRDPETGATWSGRGVRASWLRGKKLSDYLIDKTGQKKRA